MDGATAGVIVAAIIGASPPVTVALMKFIPGRREHEINGRYAKASDVAALSAKVDAMEGEVCRRLDRIERKLDGE